MNKNFMSIIKQLREQREFTQDELAACLGVSKSTISSYERGVNVPNVDFLEIIADYFNVSTDYLLGRTENIYNKKGRLSYSMPQSLTDDQYAYLSKMFSLLVKRELRR